MIEEILFDVILADDVEKDEIIEKVEKIRDTVRTEMRGLVETRNNAVVRTVSYSKPLSEYKNMPQHIKAMLMWNSIVGDDFRYGTKGKLWNIKGIDMSLAPSDIQKTYNDVFLSKYKVSDLDCICLPEDVPILPDYFIPDMKKIIDYACDDRVNNLTEPLYQSSNENPLF